MTPAPWSRAGRARLLLALTVLHGLCHALLSLLAPLYLCLQADFRRPDVESITALATWLVVTFALAGLLAGHLADRFGGKPVAGWGLLLHGLGTAGLAFAPSLPAARVWLVVAGLGAAGYHPVAARWLVQLFPEGVGRAIGVAALGGGLGFWLGPRFAGWRAEVAGWRAPLWQAEAWRAPMLEAGLAAAVVAVLFLACVAEPPPPVERSASPTGASRPLALGVLAAVAALGLVLIPRDFGALGLEALNSLYFQRAQGLGVGAVGALLAAKGLASLVANPLLTWLSDRGSRLAWWAATLAGSAACAAAVPLLGPAAARVAVIGHGVLLLAGYPILESALAERVPARLRGRATAVILAVVGLAGASAPKVTGGWVDRLAAAGAPDFYRGLYLGLAGAMFLSLAAIPVLAGISRRAERYANGG